MAVKRVTISLDESTADILARVGSPSGYLSDVILQRYREWQGALALLIDADFSGAELQLAMDRLIGVQESPAHARMHVAERALAPEPLAAAELSALVTLAMEYWSGNQAMREAISRLPAAAPAAPRRKAAKA
jgi:hypothetical protein